MNKVRSFRDPARLAAWSRSVLVLQIALAVSAMAVAMLFGSGFNAAAGGSDLYHLIQLVMLLFFVLGGGVVLRWIYVANANAHALGAEGMATSPALAVGWYFLPIANLVLPYQSMREIWKASGPERDWEAAPSSPWIFWWWMFWLLSCIASILSNRLAEYSYEEDMLRITEALAILSDLALIPASLLLMRIVGRITGMQRVRVFGARRERIDGRG
ncbi:DUF4328 domain-containing protein [Sphingosinicella rhizophila]|uniref:DUF4328 domain-containing protein n=1 Tax=Sphingosinicella rhizophila TaxID=3050082 RepID=A0ABU3QAZ8_9SPHN|nr:DUF4328 domain-containing protein [Sphingosinicella sp. GR2756]MDT9600579.1 DUF4328 domain-containing protein [Sphingosinicella sp. GR2756]